MPGRKADRAGVLTEPVEAQRPGIADQDTEDAAAPRKVADCRLGLLVEPGRDEAFERAARLVDHAERCVLSLGQPGGRLDDLLEERVERQLRVERNARLEQLPQTRIAPRRGLHASEGTPAARERPCAQGVRRRSVVEPSATASTTVPRTTATSRRRRRSIRPRATRSSPL